MPDLPTLTVTTAQATRILATFGDAAAYRAWLKDQIIEKVLASEATRLDETNNATKRDALKTLRDSLA